MRMILPQTRRRGFTLIELLVTMAIVSLLLALAVPRYFASLDRAKETALKEDLHQMRNAIDKFYGDTGKYPDSLADLVDKRYLRTIPDDPISDLPGTWIILPPDNGKRGAVYNIRSGTPGTARDGTLYSTW